MSGSYDPGTNFAQINANGKKEGAKFNVEFKKTLTDAEEKQKEVIEKALKDNPAIWEQKQASAAAMHRLISDHPDLTPEERELRKILLEVPAQTSKNIHKAVVIQQTNGMGLSFENGESTVVVEDLSKKNRFGLQKIIFEGGNESRLSAANYIQDRLRTLVGNNTASLDASLTELNSQIKLLESDIDLGLKKSANNHKIEVKDLAYNMFEAADALKINMDDSDFYDNPGYAKFYKKYLENPVGAKNNTEFVSDVYDLQQDMSDYRNELKRQLNWAFKERNKFEPDSDERKSALETIYKLNEQLKRIDSVMASSNRILTPSNIANLEAHDKLMNRKADLIVRINETKSPQTQKLSELAQTYAQHMKNIAGKSIQDYVEEGLLDPATSLTDGSKIKHPNAKRNATEKISEPKSISDLLHNERVKKTEIELNNPKYIIRGQLNKVQSEIKKLKKLESTKALKSFSIQMKSKKDRVTGVIGKVILFFQKIKSKIFRPKYQKLTDEEKLDKKSLLGNLKIQERILKYKEKKAKYTKKAKIARLKNSGEIGSRVISSNKSLSQRLADLEKVKLEILKDIQSSSTLSPLEKQDLIADVKLSPEEDAKLRVDYKPNPLLRSRVLEQPMNTMFGEKTELIPLRELLVYGHLNAADKAKYLGNTGFTLGYLLEKDSPLLSATFHSKGSFYSKNLLHDKPPEASGQSKGPPLLSLEDFNKLSDEMKAKFKGENGMMYDDFYKLSAPEKNKFLNENGIKYDEKPIPKIELTFATFVSDYEKSKQNASVYYNKPYSDPMDPSPTEAAAKGFASLFDAPENSTGLKRESHHARVGDLAPNEPGIASQIMNGLGNLFERVFYTNESEAKYQKLPTEPQPQSEGIFGKLGAMFGDLLYEKEGDKPKNIESVVAEPKKPMPATPVATNFKEFASVVEKNQSKNGERGTVVELGDAIKQAHKNQEKNAPAHKGRNPRAGG